MPPEEKELLDRSVALGEENNKILRSMRRSMLWGRVMTTIYWVVIIGSAIGAYYFIQPYIDQVMSVYNQAKSSLDNVSKTFSGTKK